MSLFMPLFLLSSALPGEGFPSPESRADYRIEASLSPESVLVSGRIGIDFMPAYPADTLWLHLYPNAYRDPSTAFAGDLATMGYYDFAGASDDEYGWILLDGWTLDGDTVGMEVDETLGFVPLGRTAQPGDTLRLEGGFTVKVPAIWSRMGHDGDHYEMTQWYPKMCVLDSAGWHTSRYRSDGEFYSDYGDYRVTLTLPDSFVTAATGSVDSVRYSPDSLFRTETWTASPVHDFAWAADPAFVLLEHNFIPPAGSGAPPVRVHLAVQECSADDWSEVGAWADSTLLYYGEWCGWYPYGDLWVVQSAMWGGMEYPQLVMIQPYDPPSTRYFEMVVMHEIGHQWFYGMLGNDEVDEAWLDEGINSFCEIRYFERRYGMSGNMTGLPGWVSSISDADFTSSSYVGMVASGEEVPVLSTSTEAAGGRYDYGALYYSKPALFVRMIQNQVGDDAFDAFLREYCDRFRFHHPRTGDFMAILEEVTGRSWREEFDFWLRTTGSADVRVEGLDWSGDTTVVSVSGDIPLPVELDLAVGPPGGGISTRVSLTPGEVSQVRIPGRWHRAEVDPWTRFPDRRPWNNSLPACRGNRSTDDRPHGSALEVQHLAGPVPGIRGRRMGGGDLRLDPFRQQLGGRAARGHRLHQAPGRGRPPGFLGAGPGQAAGPEHHRFDRPLCGHVLDVRSRGGLGIGLQDVRGGLPVGSVRIDLGRGLLRERVGQLRAGRVGVRGGLRSSAEGLGLVMGHGHVLVQERQDSSPRQP